jgi:hypothetical protein
MSWNPGEHVVLRWTGHRAWLDEKADRERGQVSEIPGLLQGWPHVVVEDNDELLALWMPAGAPTQLVDLADRNRAPIDTVWRKDTLRLMFPGKPFSVSMEWTPDPDREFPQQPRELYRSDTYSGEQRYQTQRSRPWAGVPEHTFRGWYVNLEAPFVRNSVGVDTTDNSLDVVIDADRAWHWKDEDTLPVLAELGIYSPAQCEQFYRDGREAIAALEGRHFPFDGSYLDWRARDDWVIPALRAGWDSVPGYDLNITTGRRINGVDHR